MQEGFKEKLVKWLTVTLLLVIIVGGLAALYPRYSRRQALMSQKADIERQIEAKHREIAKLGEYQRRFRTDPDFIEKIARNNHRVFPGELVFVFEEK